MEAVQHIITAIHQEGGETDMTVERQDVIDLLYREAKLLDEWQLLEWQICLRMMERILSPLLGNQMQARWIHSFYP